MIKNYKAFLNIILSLSLILFPSYGYPELKKADLKLFKRVLQKQHPDFKPPSHWKKALIILMEIGEAMEKGEMEDYLDKHPYTPYSLDMQWLGTSEFEEIFHILKELSQAIELGRIDEYVEQNPDLVDYFDKKNKNVTGFGEIVKTLQQRDIALLFIIAVLIVVGTQSSHGRVCVSHVTIDHGVITTTDHGCE